MQAGQVFKSGIQPAAPWGRRSGAQRGILENTSARGLSRCPLQSPVSSSTPLRFLTALPTRLVSHCKETGRSLPASLHNRLASRAGLINAFEGLRGRLSGAEACTLSGLDRHGWSLHPSKPSPGFHPRMARQPFWRPRACWGPGRALPKTHLRKLDLGLAYLVGAKLQPSRHALHHTLTGLSSGDRQEQ